MKNKQQVEIKSDFDKIADGFYESAQKPIIKQTVMAYRCSHIHGEKGQVIDTMTPENAYLFNSASVTVKDAAGRLSGNVFSEGSSWDFTSIEEGMFSVQTMRGVAIFDEYVDQPIGVFDHVSSFKNGLAVVGKNGLLGIINKVGQEIVPITYKDSSYEISKYKKVEQFEVLGGIIVALGEGTVDVYSKHGEKLYVTDKNGYDADMFSKSPTRKFITQLSRIENLREINRDLKQSTYDEKTKERINDRIDNSITRMILSLGSMKNYEEFTDKLGKVLYREDDPIYKQVKSKKYKARLETEIERLKYIDPHPAF